ncbi:MAG: site-specific DNA-methyltransferase, partial [Synergistaceae bacterium]|nr:site-specific DNA-methyltransferase [Synergistaceae bacterium]
TETIDENGAVVRAINADVLAQEINSHVVKGKEERYQFTWPDKKKSVLFANAPIAATLRPCREESVNFDSTENLYIEGDNLDVVKMLRETYLNRVKMIYIDPPYNTGNDFIYEDDFSEDAGEFLARDGQYDEDGNRMVKNLDSNGRFHTDWLNMIYPRLRVARDLLAENGVIFISIDDGEVAQLRKICDEIFGEYNFVAEIVWEGANKNDARQIGIVHEYVLVFAKNRIHLEYSWSIKKDGLELVLKEIEVLRQQYGDDYDSASKSLADWFRSMKATPSFGLRRFHKIDACGAYKEDDPTAPGGRKFNLINPITGDIIPLRKNRGWSFDQGAFEKMVGADRIVFVSDKSIMVKRYLHEIDSVTPPSVMYQPARSASERLERLMDEKIFDFPKDETIIKKFLEMSSQSGDIILDFFSGSATTAHAVMRLNAEDGGKRKFIMVQLPEICDEGTEAAKAGYANICEIGKERIRRAGAKIKNESPLFTQDLDVGFRVLKLDSSNMRDVYYTPREYPRQMDLDGFVDNIKDDRTPEDLLFQVMLDLNVPLSNKIEVKEIEGKAVYYVNDGYLTACFEKVDDALMTEIALAKPYYAVFRDSGFASDSTLVNFGQIFKTYSPTTQRRVL